MPLLLVGVDDDVADVATSTTGDAERTGTSAEALDRLEAGTRCVVTALELPDWNGFDLAERLLERSPPPSVIVIGDEPVEDVARRAIGSGIHEYVPWQETSPDGLATTLQEARSAHADRLDRHRVSDDGPDLVCVLRAGVIDATSADVAELLGVDDAEGVPFHEFVAAADSECVVAALEDADHRPVSVDFRPAGDDQRTVEARLRRSPIDGAVVARLTDVTERADRIAALEAAKARLDSLLRDVPMSIYFKDALGRHERVSDFITETDPEDYIMNDEGKVHPHPEDVIGKTDFDLYAPSFAEGTYADDTNVIEDEERVINRIEPGTTSLGEPLYTSTTKVPRYDEDDEVVGLVGVTIDVTERVTHREELERQNDRLNEFAEVLTHDLRNPLNIADGYVEVLEDGYDETAVRETSDALDRIEALIEEIRAFVLEGRLVEDPEAVDLRAAAQEAWTTVDTCGATLDLEGDLHIQADGARLRRLLENLFRNAIEHGTPDGDGQELTIRVVAGDRAFAVEDDGVGVSTESAGEVFERGFTTSDDGTGFGLAIVESIAEAHGWTVAVEESEDGGARFVFDVVQAQVGMGRTIA